MSQTISFQRLLGETQLLTTREVTAASTEALTVNDKLLYIVHLNQN